MEQFRRGTRELSLELPSGVVDDGEDIRVRLHPAAEVRRRVLAGEIDTAATLGALALWDWGDGGFTAGRPA